MASSTSVSNSLLAETDYYSLLIDHAIENKFSIALWRLPNDPVIRVLISRKPKLLKFTAALEDLPAGFIFAPFEASADRIFLEADLTFSFSEGRLNEPVTPIEASSNIWLDGMKGYKQNKSERPKIYVRHTNPITTTPKDFFLDLVTDAVSEIEKGVFEKVVLSRTKVIQPTANLDCSLAFKKLCRLYNNALISFISIPEVGSWLGASPELLVSVEGKRIFKTTALAGTQAYSEGVSLKAVAWTQKDIEEQALVERYIISCFKKIRLREYEEHGPRTVVAGNLIHLKSDFTVDMQATNFPQLGSVMLQLLHPTSAVCGVPLDTALEFIHKREGYDRQFYAGYLGPVNFQDRIDIFVNLRCLQLLHKNLILYSGAGITQDSVPEKEWEETELKLNTLLNVIE
jgi:isochorismate synthase